MWTREQLKSEAKKRMIKFYWPAVLVSFIVLTFAEGGGAVSNYYNFNNRGSEYYSNYRGLQNRISSIPASVITLIVGIAILVMVLAWLYQFFVANILAINEKRFYLCSREYKASLGEIGYAFTNGNYLRSVGTMFLRDLFIFLWSLLLIVPGIIKSYEYRMIPYLLAENPQLSAQRAFELSKEMMKGQKWNTFVLDLSFILWGILGAITCIGVYFIRPYIVATQVELYTVLKDISKKNGITNDYELVGFYPQN